MSGMSAADIDAVLGALGGGSGPAGGKTPAGTGAGGRKRPSEGGTRPSESGTRPSESGTGKKTDKSSPAGLIILLILLAAFCGFLWAVFISHGKAAEAVYACETEAEEEPAGEELPAGQDMEPDQAAFRAVCFQSSLSFAF